MKITVDIDLSPAEARELLGWPDLSALHQTTIELFTEQLKSGNKDAVQSVLEPYLNGSQQAFTMYQKMMDGVIAKATATPK